MVGIVTQQAVNKRTVFWMWHPANHGDRFKGRVIYEGYPDSQEDVDRLMQGLQRVRVIYDRPDEYLQWRQSLSARP